MNARQFVAIQIHAETGKMASRELLNFIERCYGVMPDGDQIADLNWLITIRGPSIDLNKKPMLLWCGRKSPKQFIEIPPTMTRRQFMCLCEAFEIETH